MIRCAAIFFFSVAPALADSCASFNRYQFSPNELERCIKELKDANTWSEIRIQNLENEKEFLKDQVCDLAIEIAKINPTAGIVSLSCGRPRRPSPKPLKPPALPSNR